MTHIQKKKGGGGGSGTTHAHTQLGCGEVQNTEQKKKKKKTKGEGVVRTTLLEKHGTQQWRICPLNRRLLVRRRLALAVGVAACQRVVQINSLNTNVIVVVILVIVCDVVHDTIAVLCRILVEGSKPVVALGMKKEKEKNV